MKKIFIVVKINLYLHEKKLKVGPWRLLIVDQWGQKRLR